MAEERSGLADGTERAGEATARPADRAASDAGGAPEFEEGRYVFCVVRAPGDGEAPSFSAEGIDGREVDVVARGAVAAVVQPCESLYDASDPATVKRWLLRHQAVVDAAGEAFGTPLPFRFDTVVVGDDAAVREWLDENAAALDDALDDLAGRWEYRIDLGVEEAVEAEGLEASDDRLASLREEIEESEEGRAFLMEKQYEEQLRALRRERREARAEDLLARVEPLAERVERTGGSATSGTAVLDAGGSGDSTDDADRRPPDVSLSVLATEERADEIGEELEAVAGEPGVEVRYTGPWPPYTFAPAIDADGER